MGSISWLLPPLYLSSRVAVGDRKQVSLSLESPYHGIHRQLGPQDLPIITAVLLGGIDRSQEISQSWWLETVFKPSELIDYKLNR